MAYISKTGISNTSTINAEHITRIIDALDGTASTEVSASGQFEGTHSGSFSGSFVGDGTNITGVTAEWDGSHNGNASITGSLNVTSTISASNFTGTTSGANTGDQDLSSYALRSNVVTNSATASFAQTVNVVANTATASFITNAQTSSMSVATASFLIGGGGGGFPFTGSAAILGTLSLDGAAGHITASGDISASGLMEISSSLRIDGDRAFFHKEDRNYLIINDLADFDQTIIGRTGVSTPLTAYGNVTASGHISCSSAQSIMTATTGAFNHIITDGETLEFRNATTRAKIGSLKFDPTRGLDVQDQNGDGGKMKAKTVEIPSGGNLIVSASQVDFTNLPTSDPSVAGRLWSNRGVVTVSAGG